MSLGIILLMLLSLWFVAHFGLMQIANHSDEKWRKTHLGSDDDYPAIARFYNEWDDVLSALSAILSLMFLIWLLFASVGQLESRAFVAEYKNVAHNYSTRGDQFSDIERAASFSQIISYNGQVAKYKYYNNAMYGIFDLNVTDQIDTLEPIQ